MWHNVQGSHTMQIYFHHLHLLTDSAQLITGFNITLHDICSLSIL